MDGYRTVVNARAEVAKTRLENNRQTVVAFQAQTNAQIANAEVKSKYYLATADIGMKKVIPGMLKSKDLEVAAISSRSLRTARKWAMELGIPKSYGSY